MDLFASPVVLAVAALWIAAALILSFLALRQHRTAARLIESARAIRATLDQSPARPIFVTAGEAIECDVKLARDLGFADLPQRLNDLDGRKGTGLEETDFLSLKHLVKSCSTTAKSFQMKVRMVDEGRVFAVDGVPARSPAPEGAVLLWFTDHSEDEANRASLEKRLGQTENALDSLTQLIESAPFPMWYRGPNLSLGLVNSAFVTAVEGEDAAEVIARGAELIDGTGRGSAEAGAREALERGQPYSRTQPATIGGERRMLRLVDVPLSDGAVAGFALDIQDLEDARTELSRFVQSQRDLADRMAAGAAQFNADRRLDFYNQPFAVMAQLEPDELADHPEFDRVLEAMRERGRTPEARDFPEWKAKRREWFTAPDEMIEEDWILANGDHLRVVGQPLPDGGLRLILEDRTEQVRLASARDTLLRVRAATFDNLFEVISVFASDGRLYLWNRRFSELWDLDEAWLTEHPRVDELVPAMAKKLVTPTDSAQVRELVRAATSGRKPGQGRMSMSDGRHFDFAAVPLPDGNALFTMIEVTDSQRIEAALRERAKALEEADRVKTDFVANMSYELRTPLTSIGGFAEMLGQGYAGRLEPAAAEYVAAIITSVERLSRLIDNVLDLTQAEAGMEIDRDRIDAAGLVRAAVSGLLGRAKERDIEIDLRVGEDMGTVIGDARRLREAIDHILRNAIAYSNESSVIQVHTRGHEDRVEILIADDGPGIPVEQHEAVFERFHRSAGQRGEAAMGLGLPLAREFVEAHGGSVQLDSEPGKGTRVTLSVPRDAR